MLRASIAIYLPNTDIKVHCEAEFKLYEMPDQSQLQCSHLAVKSLLLSTNKCLPPESIIVEGDGGKY